MGDTFTINITSCGLKHGEAVEADLRVDVRSVPNPYWVPHLRPFDGLNSEVSQYVLETADAQELVNQTLDAIEAKQDELLRNQRSSMSVAITCTGGRHRSVAIAEELRRRLTENGRTVSVAHRDVHLV